MDCCGWECGSPGDVHHSPCHNRGRHEVAVVGAIAYIGSVVAIVGPVAYIGSVVAVVGPVAYIGSVTVVVSHIGTVIPIPAVCGCLALLNRSAVLFSTHAIGRRAIVWAVGILRRARNRRRAAALS